MHHPSPTTKRNVSLDANLESKRVAAWMIAVGAGMAATLDSEPDSQRRKKRRFAFAVAVAAFALMGAAGGAGLVAFNLRGIRFPSPAEITSERAIVLKSADGHDLLSRGAFRLAPLAVKQMPPVVIDAVLSVEDHDFYRHGAIDAVSTLRALIDNIEAGQIVAGGSTITQQLVKILFLNPQRTYHRKIQEAAIAFWLEHKLSKDQILTAYLNNVYLGSGAVGFPAAAKLYFSKTVGELTVPEAAMLAGLINAPSEDDPLRNLDAARRRAAIVIDAMVANGKLMPQAALLAKLHPATPDRTELAPPSAGWFADWVYDRVAAATTPTSGTVRVDTTLDLHLQKLASDIVKETLAKYGAQKHVTQAALVAMRPDGAVVAMVGGRSYSDSTYNRAVQAERQPGSAFKLFDYYAALRAGFTPGDEVLDAPVDIHGWQPRNYGGRDHGEVTLAEAFAHSLNDATVRLTQEVGINDVVSAARDLGLRARLSHEPSLALGTSDVSLLDLTSAYAAVRAGKAPVVPWGIAGLGTASKNSYVPVGTSGQPQHSLGQYQDQLISLLRGVVLNGTGRGAALSGFAAGKTGTTQDYRDAWFVGFNDSLIVGVWVGNDDHSPMHRVVGGSLPALIWKQFMEQSSTPAVTASAGDAVSQRVASGQMLQTAAQSYNQLLDRYTAARASVPANGSCNIPDCQRDYQSFRVSDCTYQPYSGPRELCER
jgi:penicillin-binding protein 1A